MSLLGIVEDKNNLHCSDVTCDNEKPQAHIWSLAHTADVRNTEDIESSDNRSISPNYRFARGPPAHGLCTKTRSLPSTTHPITHTENYSKESSQPAKIFNASKFNLQSFHRSCPYPVLGETYQYSAVGGIAH